MSLYSFIHNREDVREGFRERVLRPLVKFDRPLQAAPRTTNYRIVGTAFDYLLRFFLERVNPHANASIWVAEQGVRRIGLPQGELDGDALAEIDANPERQRAEAYLRDAKSNYEVFLRTGQLTEALLLSALRLAHLDVIIRAGPDRVDWVALESLNPEDVVDLKALLALVDERTFKTTHTCILNPTFGAASALVGGADADLILDDCLVDVKTTKEPRLDIRDFYQLVGYYLLLGLGGLGSHDAESQQPQVASLGIYFSRFGYLWKVPVEEVVPESVVLELTKWFVETACPPKQSRAKFVRSFRGPLAKHLIDEKKNNKPKTTKSKRASRAISKVKKR